jgi:uncharacterized protein YbjT (DUF2867 family)
VVADTPTSGTSPWHRQANEQQQIPPEGALDVPHSLTEAFEGVDGMFLLAGYAGIPELLALARRAGVKRVVALTGSSAALDDMANAVTRTMAEAEQAVRASGLNWTILRPRQFMSNALRWLPQLQAGDVVRVPFADVPYAAIDPAHISAFGGRGGRGHLLTGNSAYSIRAYSAGSELAGVELATRCDRS